MIDILDTYDDSYYKVVVIGRGQTKFIKYTYSAHGKIYINANGKEVDYMENLGVNIGDGLFDFFRIEEIE